jgi:hypothetical protein
VKFFATTQDTSGCVIIYKMYFAMIGWVHFKLSPVGGDTNRGSAPWAVSPPPTIRWMMRQFEMHPIGLLIKNLAK